MAPSWQDIVPRDEASPGSSTASSGLDTGAIAGIACAAGALFLGGIGLFLVYWRRQKHFGNEQDFIEQPIEENPLRRSHPVYTLDYKQHQDSIAEESSPSYTYNAESESFTPLGAPLSVSAMPTHPAYIPRALVRGTTPIPFATTPEDSTPRSQLTMSPPPPRPQRTKSRPDDLVMQAYLRHADGERVTSEIIRYASADDERNPAPYSGSESPGSSTLPLRNHQGTAPRSQLATVAVPNFALSRPAQPSPPRLTVETSYTKPTARRDRDMEITAPLELAPTPPTQHREQFAPFQQRYQQSRSRESPQEGSPSNKRTFKDRTQAQGIGQTMGHRRDNSTSRRIGDWIAAQPQFTQSEIRPHQRDQVPPDSDVW
jgi:hypothetical protein